jgi:hypothetical protein
MKTRFTSLRSFERIARSRGIGMLLIGGLMVIFWLGGHGVLYSAYHLAGVDVPARVLAV